MFNDQLSQGKKALIGSICSFSWWILSYFVMSLDIGLRSDVHTDLFPAHTGPCVQLQPTSEVTGVHTRTPTHSPPGTRYNESKSQTGSANISQPTGTQHPCSHSTCPWKVSKIPALCLFLHPNKHFLENSHLRYVFLNPNSKIQFTFQWVSGDCFRATQNAILRSTCDQADCSLQPRLGKGRGAWRLL